MAKIENRKVDSDERERQLTTFECERRIFQKDRVCVFVGGERQRKKEREREGERERRSEREIREEYRRRRKIEDRGKMRVRFLWCIKQ